MWFCVFFFLNILPFFAMKWSALYLLNNKHLFYCKNSVLVDLIFIACDFVIFCFHESILFVQILFCSIIFHCCDEFHWSKTTCYRMYFLNWEGKKEKTKRNEMIRKKNAEHDSSVCFFPNWFQYFAS